MRSQLQLVKPLRAKAEDREVREIRYRYPAEEPVWEVSCDGMDEQPRRSPIGAESQRAS